MTTKRPEFFSGVSTGTSTTSPSVVGEIWVDSVATSDFEKEVALVEAHARERVSSSTPDVAAYAREALALVGVLRRALRGGDVSAAASAGFQLGRHVEEWRAKDHAEAHFNRGRRNLQSIRDATTQAALAKRATRRPTPGAWLREVEGRRGGTEAAVHVRIAEREGITPGAVKRAIQRLRTRK